MKINNHKEDIIKTVLVLILIMSTITIYSQKDKNKINNEPVFKEILSYSNNIKKYWRAEKFDTAIDYAIKLSKSNHPFLQDKVHNELIFDIEKNINGASEFLIKLYNFKNKEVNDIIESAYLWNRIRITQSKDSLLTFFTKLENELKRNILTQSKPELYNLKALTDLEKKEIINREHNEKLCLFIIGKLKENIDKNKNLFDKKSSRKRAYSRSILAYTYHYLFKLTKNDNFLKLSSFYSPDNLDKQNKAGYIGALRFLTKETNNFGFQEYYINYLIQNDRKKEALKILSILTRDEPLNSNLNKLKFLFKEINYPISFKEYWYSIFSEGAEKFPELKFKTLNGVNITTANLKNKWTLIDFWGTWCKPCLLELPEIENFYKISKKKYDGMLNVLTISFNSKDLKTFIETNKYTFPVIEIDDKVRNQIGINSFPTKILISPDGQFRVIPFGFRVNWIEYINNYILLGNNTLQ